MPPTQSFLQQYSQNNKLPIRLVSPTFGHLGPEVGKLYGLTHRKAYYFLIFMQKGRGRHGVDLQQLDIGDNELLFILPNQIHSLPLRHEGTAYFKLGFDESCLSRLPVQYPFLINPFNNQKVGFTAAAASRLGSVFEVLGNLLSQMDSSPDLILAHLNSLLTEINAAYFNSQRNPADENLSKYIRFKLFVEEHLSEQPSVTDIALQLGLNTNSLYSIVRHYSGIAPKEYLRNRLVLEAKRRLYYSESTSVKELAYDLGFNDPEYFSRLFKNVTGKTITMFLQDLSGH